MRREQGSARGRQLDRQRKTVEEFTEFRNILECRRASADQRQAVSEHLDRSVLGEAADLDNVLRVES